MAWNDVVVLAAQALGAIGLILLFRRLQNAFLMVGEPSLRRLGIGFLLLAMSQVVAMALHVAVLQAGVVLEAGFDHIDILFWLYYGSLLAGLGGVFWSFGRHPLRWGPAVAPVLLLAGPVLEILVIVALFFVVLHAGLNHIAKKGTGSGIVALAFFFVFCAHTLFLVGYAPAEPRSWYGELVNLAGIVILYVAVARPRKVLDA